MIRPHAGKCSPLDASSPQIDLQAAAAHRGTYTFRVSAQRAVSDPDTLDSESLLGRVVVLQVAQARA